MYVNENNIKNFTAFLKKHTQGKNTHTGKKNLEYGDSITLENANICVLFANINPNHFGQNSGYV